MSSSSQLTTTLSRLTSSGSNTASSASSSASGISSGGGCVSCPDSPSCPVCASDEYCIQTSLTCEQCPTTYCAKKTLSSNSTSSSNSSSSTSSQNKTGGSSSAKVGGIVGGVVGGVIVIAIIALLYFYFKYWRKNRQNHLVDEKNKEAIAMDPESVTDSEGDLKSRTRTSTLGISRSMNTAGDRSSAMTVQTRASNILPIAYIPGVTAGGGKNGKKSQRPPPLPRHLFNNGDTRSHITLGSSILGGDDDDDDDDGDHDEDYNGNDNEHGFIASNNRNGQIHGGEQYQQKKNPSTDALTTAIRAKPKLVQITEEQEEDESQDVQDVSTANKTAENALEKNNTSTIMTMDPFILDDSDQNQSADSDINDDDDDGDDDDDNDGEGSFILDLEVSQDLRSAPADAGPATTPAHVKDSDGSGSPFEDRFKI